MPDKIGQVRSNSDLERMFRDMGDYFAEEIVVVNPDGSPVGGSGGGETSPSTGTTTSVANAIASGTILAANVNRKGATIFNDDTAGTGATLKIKLGATASVSSFTYAIAPMGYYEVPFGYTGVIDGIASAATGNVRITEVV